MYIQSYKGADPNNPQDVQYLEYIHSPSAMYKYAMFSNTNLVFSGDNLYDLKGGNLHTNGDLIFGVGGTRFNDVGSISAHGTIRYAQKFGWFYPSPGALDSLVDDKIDGMAPAPPLSPESAANPTYAYVQGDHYRTTNGDIVMPGPLRNWATYPSGDVYLKAGWSQRGDTVGGSPFWGTDGAGGGSYPIDFAGEETFFYGRQTRYGSHNPWAGLDMATNKYIDSIGTVGNNPVANNTVTSFYMDQNVLKSETSDQGAYSWSDAYFKPFKNKSGNSNSEWFELPGALPQSYDYGWQNKYSWPGNSETPVQFYVTESCPEGAAGCYLDPLQKTIDPANTTGWRYLKKDTAGNTCTTNACYEAATSQYLSAKDYSPGFEQCKKDREAQCKLPANQVDGECVLPLCSESTYQKYYDIMFNGASSDVNKQFIDSNYVYGSDAATHSPWMVDAFDTNKQPDGFRTYLNELSQKGIEGTLNSGVNKKEPYLGQLFNTQTTNSPYKQKAINGGLYIGGSNLETIKTQLNSLVPVGQEYASVKTFYNWKSAGQVAVIVIDVSKMPTPGNGIVYADVGVPIMLSNADRLPGVNGSNGKTAVFTVVSEESVYLKGDYNTDPDWKISNIATKKRVYTLSDNFNFPDDYVPATKYFPNYPYIKVSVTGRNGDIVTSYGTVVSDDYTGDSAWINAIGVQYFAGECPNMSAGLKALVWDTMLQREETYRDANSEHFPNEVADKSSYTYNSLFVTPYDFEILEDWQHNGAEVSRNIQGAFINFSTCESYDEACSDNYKATLGEEEYSHIEHSVEGFNFDAHGRTLPWTAPFYWAHYNTRIEIEGFVNPPTTKSYDGRFPTACPTSNEGVLGFTGQDSWRPISKDYFDAQTGA